jgi:phosphodiesterase/alkaline phosphatase D-like protein
MSPRLPFWLILQRRMAMSVLWFAVALGAQPKPFAETGQSPINPRIINDPACSDAGYAKNPFTPQEPQQSPLIEAGNTSEGYPISIVEWIWAGAVTPNAARIVAKLGHRDDVFLLISTNDDFSPARRIEAERMVSVPGGWIAHFSLDSLEPATAYHYIIERKGRVLRQHAGQLRTFPVGRAPLRIATASCANTGSNHPVFHTIESLRPDFFLHLGDLHYEDIAINDRDLFFAAYDRVLTAPRQAALYRSIAIAYIWDDHDYGPNNSDKTSPSREAALASYQTAVPHYPLAQSDGDAIYQAFSHGKIRFILLDTRSQRSHRAVPDGPGRTMLGGRQLQWLKQELLAAHASHDLIVLVNSVPWIGDTPHYDNWSGFAYERAQIAAFIEEHAITRLCMISGDAHMIAIDDGTNNRYGPSGKPLFPVLQAAALDRRGSVKGGPYRFGPIPGPGHFGVMEINYIGSQQLEVRFACLQTEGSIVFEHQFTQSTVD